MNRILLLALAIAALAQPADPIPDKLRADILRAHRDQLAADKDKQTAMMAYHAAESRYEGATHNLALLQSAADMKCAPKRFDLDKVECR